MSKPIQYKTTETPYGWEVNVPPKLSDTGKRQRRYFDTRKLAAGFISSLRVRVENHGTGARMLNAWQEEQAAAAFGLIEGAGIEKQLAEIVADFIDRLNKRKASVTFADAFGKFEVADTGRRSDSYKRSLRQFKDRLEVLHTKMLCDIRPSDLDAAMTGFPASVYNYGMRILGGVFNFGKKREWCDENPVEKLDRKTRPTSEVHIYTPGQVAAIMAAADSQLAPWLSVCMFAGLRASEARQITWGDIDLVEKFVRVRAAVSKTRHPRAIAISDNLRQWLLANRKTPENLIAPQGLNVLRRQLREAHKAAGVPQIKHGPRHCFASYLLSRDGDIDALTLAMGHDDADTTFRHYHRTASKKDAVKFWKIVPSKVPKKGKIIPMPEEVAA